MNKTSFALFVLLVSTAVLAVGLFAQSPGGRQNTIQNQNSRLEYATLYAATSGNGTQVTYSLLWNAGVRDYTSQSQTSMDDARRKLLAQLGLSNNTQTNLSVFLTSLGGQGWRLIQTGQSEPGDAWIFVRSAN